MMAATVVFLSVFCLLLVMNRIYEVGYVRGFEASEKIWKPAFEEANKKRVELAEEYRKRLGDLGLRQEAFEREMKLRGE